MVGAVFNLNHATHVVHWHFFEMSLPDVLALAVTVAVFVLAIVVRLPGTAGVASAREDGP